MIEPWSDNDVEAFFLIDCHPHEKNRKVAGGHQNPYFIRLATTCADAHAIGRRAHAAYNARDGAWRSVPLVMLRREAWEFVHAPDERRA